MTTIEQLLKRGPDVTDDARRAAARAAEAARGEGLVDVSYVVEPSPLGDLVLAVTPRGLVRIAYGANVATDAVLDELAQRISPRVLESPSALDEVRRELDEYFAGRRTTFDLPIDWRLHDGFSRRVLRATSRIPYGHVLSYGQVAAKAGSPRAHRAAGNALGANKMPIVVPCHRVVRTGGALGGYTGGIERKKYLLGLEGLSE
jgi:methylated-DNA-[protein]-cysteine S-methyltransferase